MPDRLTTLLIANRGEIAVRICRTARDMGLKTVAVFSDADRGAPHVVAAHEAINIGPAPVAQSYLSIENILAAAKASNADAVHPGYGFLAENAEFAEACAEAGLIFVGPPPEAVRLMGNKRLAKERMIEAGVPCVPGFSGAAQDDETLIAEAADVGFPLMVKAAAGGGGRGMRRVEESNGLVAALASARSEALAGFGSDELILERAVDRPRHVEIQVFADTLGNAIHLGERDCSVQRRHQKVIEEAPSPAVDEDLRARMGDAAVACAQAIGYVGAGTVEFLLDAEGNFYFMEMNTRLQVEHPVTEMTTGQDLVAWQIRIARGEALPLTQDELELNGHAIEVRLYTEDPANGFLPRTGKVLAWRPPEGEGVRVDAAVAEGMEVTPHYDAMIAKIVAFGPTRDEARLRLMRALEDCTLMGVTTNQDFLRSCLGHMEFAAGEATTAFIEDNESDLLPDGDHSRLRRLAAALLATRDADNRGPWFSTATAAWPLQVVFGDNDPVAVEVVLRGSDDYEIAIGEEDAAPLSIQERAAGRVFFDAGEGLEQAQWLRHGEAVHVALGAIALSASEAPVVGATGAVGGDGNLRAPMPGRVVRTAAKIGDKVAADDILVVLEAMKMEHEISAGIDGRVTEVNVAEGDQVNSRQLLVRVETESSE